MKNTTLTEIIIMSNINFYTRIFTGNGKKESNLSYTESMIVNIIDSLDKPTVNELVKILKISQPNISYKINTLVSKGYIEKIQSKDDGREFILKLTDRFKTYKENAFSFVDEVFENLEDKLSDEEIKIIYKSLEIVKKEMGEIKAGAN